MSKALLRVTKREGQEWKGHTEKPAPTIHKVLEGPASGPKGPANREKRERRDGSENVKATEAKGIRAKPNQF